MNNSHRVVLWDAINRIVAASGGSPGNTSVARQRAVVEVERIVTEIEAAARRERGGGRGGAAPPRTDRSPKVVPPRQAVCFSAIVDCLERGLVPMMSLLAYGMGLSSMGSVHQHLVRLERRGLIKRAGSPRGVLRLTKKGRTLAWGEDS